MIALGSDFDGISGPLELDSCARVPLLADALRKAGFNRGRGGRRLLAQREAILEENL